MKTEIVDQSPTRKELKIEIEPAEIRAEFDRVSNQYARQASVPGFRKGHAPVGVVRTRYRKEIRGDVLQNLLPKAVNDAINESGLNVVGEPDVHLDNDAALEKLGEQPISLHVKVEVLPEVTLGEYRGLEAARRTRPVTEEEVERIIESLREGAASLQPVEDRPAQDGDTVTINVRGRFLSHPDEEDINVEDVDVVLGGEGVVAEFTEHLAGVRPDDVKTFTVKYPEDFRATGLAGKEVEYTATVTAVRVKEVPELDDEFVRSLGEGEVETVEGLRGRVRENLSAHARYESEARLRDDILGQLITRHQFELPDTLVEYQLSQLLRSTVSDMLRHGVDPRGQEIDWEGLRESLRERAREDLRGSLLLEKIAEAENIEVADEEIEVEILALAEASRQTVEQVRAALTKQGGERSIADRLRSRKALDLVVAGARVRDEEWRDEAGEPALDDAAGEEQQQG